MGYSDKAVKMNLTDVQFNVKPGKEQCKSGLRNDIYSNIYVW